MNAPANKQTHGVGLHYHDIKRHFGATQVLNSLNLAIAAGEFIAIVGRSGCGKSTLLRITGGLDQPNSGELSLSRRRNEVTTRVMYQEARLLPWKTVIQNTGLGLTGDWQEKAKRVLSQVGLADKADLWPAQLSGGQRQRISLARALIHHPHLLLLDEPLGALDALTRIEMQQLIEDLWLSQQFTAVLVTHDVSEAVALADRILLIENGVIGLDLKVDLPRPRARGSAQYAAIEQLVLARVLEQPIKETRFVNILTQFKQLKWAW